MAKLLPRGPCVSRQQTFPYMVSKRTKTYPANAPNLLSLIILRKTYVYVLGTFLSEAGGLELRQPRPKCGCFDDSPLAACEIRLPLALVPASYLPEQDDRAFTSLAAAFSKAVEVGAMRTWRWWRLVGCPGCRTLL